MSSVGEDQSQSDSTIDSGWMHRIVGRVAAERTLDGAVATLLESLHELNLIQVGSWWQRAGETSAWQVSLRRPVRAIAPAGTDQQWDLVERVVRSQQPDWRELDLPGEVSPEWESPEVCCVGFPVVVDQRVEGVVELVTLGGVTDVERFLEFVPFLATQLGYVRKLEQLECQVTATAERERERLGEAMHDGLGPQIAGIAMLAEAAARRYAQQQLGKELMAIANAASEAKAQARWLTRGLLPMEVDPSGLMDALCELAEQTEACHSVSCAVESDEAFRAGNAKIATHLYLIAKESVHNAVKHAAADTIVLRLDSQEGGRLQVRDNGRGIDPQEEGACSGHGLRIMRQRAMGIGWQLCIAPGNEGGTVVTCSKGEP